MALANIHLTDLRLNLIVYGSFLSSHWLYACPVFIPPDVECVCRTMLHRFMQSCSHRIMITPPVCIFLNLIKTISKLFYFIKRVLYHRIVCVCLACCWKHVYACLSNLRSSSFFSANGFGIHIHQYPFDWFRVVMKNFPSTSHRLRYLPIWKIYTDHSNNVKYMIYSFYICPKFVNYCLSSPQEVAKVLKLHATARQWEDYLNQCFTKVTSKSGDCFLFFIYCHNSCFFFLPNGLKCLWFYPLSKGIYYLPGCQIYLWIYYIHCC